MFPFATDNSRIPDFNKMPGGLLPTVVQDARTGAVLMLGYMNREALEETRKSGKVTFYSRSKERLWTKGESSGNFLHLKELRIDCDGDALLVKVEPIGPVCHTGDDTCWQEHNNPARFLEQLELVIRSRKNEPSEHSYTARLFNAGISKIAQKVGEEAVETILEAMGDDREKLLNETADLLFHLLVLLAEKEITLQDVEAVLKERMR